MKIVSVPAQSMLPESVRNIIESANVSTRIALKTFQGVERAVDGVDELATTMLKQQHTRLLAELEPV